MEQVLVLITAVVNLLIAITNLTVIMKDQDNKRRKQKKNSKRYRR